MFFFSFEEVLQAIVLLYGQQDTAIIEEKRTFHKQWLLSSTRPMIFSLLNKFCFTNIKN